MVKYTIAHLWKHDGKIAVPMYEGKPMEVFDNLEAAQKFLKRCNGSKSYIVVALDADLHQEPGTIYGPSTRKYEYYSGGGEHA
jgi:hypothetical protein